MPRVSQLKGTDVWMLICICFIFLSLAEFAFVSNVARIQKNRNSKQILFTPGGRRINLDNYSNKTSLNVWLLNLNVNEVDRLSLRFFPLLFVLCNIVYWSFYLIQ